MGRHYATSQLFEHVDDSIARESALVIRNTAGERAVFLSTEAKLAGSLPPDFFTDGQGARLALFPSEPY